MTHDAVHTTYFGRALAATRLELKADGKHLTSVSWCGPGPPWGLSEAEGACGWIVGAGAGPERIGGQAPRGSSEWIALSSLGI